MSETHMASELRSTGMVTSRRPMIIVRKPRQVGFESMLVHDQDLRPEREISQVPRHNGTHIQRKTTIRL
jgi:hypothetical protein